MSVINQKEYLKKYLSGNDQDEKKKKKKRKKPGTSVGVKISRSMIVDDDVDVRRHFHQASENEEASLLLEEDEAPLVASVVDERPEEEIRLEAYRSSNKWKTLAKDEDQSSPQPKNARDFSTTHGRTRHDSDSDLSPTRMRHPPSTERAKSHKEGHSRKRDLESGGDGEMVKRRNKSDSDDASPPRQRQRHDSDSDMSPPRVKQQNFRHRHNSDSDLSPPRVKQHLSPVDGQRNSRQRHDSDSDMSPVRRRGPDKSVSGRKSHNRHDSDSDTSPPRQKKVKSADRNGERRPGGDRHRHDSDSDLSPPRDKKISDRYSVRHPPKRTNRHDSDSDLSPERSKKLSPHRNSDKHKRKRGVSPRYDSDLSPPRQQKSSSRDKDMKRLRDKPRSRHDSDSDLSPPRGSKRRDVSPLQRRKRRDSDSDLSPPRAGGSRRRGTDSGSDLSPPRRADRGDEPKPSKTLSGAKAGLSNAAELRRENEAMRKRNSEAYSKLSDDVSGRNAETVFRDKSGKKRDLKMERLQKREEEAKQMEEDEKFMQWGKGLAQSKKQEDNVADVLKEMAKPLARYKDDQDLDSMLKEQDREGDPMLAFLKKKESKAKLKAGIKEMPRYKGPLPPPNRFKIHPGYRWDGVDRSNGFEKKYFQRISDKRATSEIAYKWSVEDM